MTDEGHQPVARAHDHHRDVRTRPHAAHPSRRADQDRHLMAIIAASPCRNARCFRQCSTGPDGARTKTQPNPQRDQSSSFEVRRPDRNKPMIQRNDLRPCAASSRYLADAPSTALKSPWRIAARPHVPIPAVSSF